MNIQIRHRCDDFETYRAARVKSLFNVDSAAAVDIDVELPIEAQDWQIGVVVGPSGSGKSSIGAELWGGGYLWQPSWPDDQPVIEAIAPDSSFDAVTGALASVGLGSVPTWLRPYPVLSNGERFRADLAKVLADKPAKVVIDEFSSVVDRQIAQIAAGAFAKAWRRHNGQAVLLTCHYDVLDWLQPDWVFDTATGEYHRGRLRWCKPTIELDIQQTDWSHWKYFEPHHYLKLPNMMAATCYIGLVNGEAVAHIAFTTRPGLVEARAARFVVLPEWQGLGIGRRMLDALCQLWMQGQNRYNKPMPTMLNTSHPGLTKALRRDPKWTQISARLYGDNSAKSRKTLAKAALKFSSGTDVGSFGGHFRGIQGFRYLGDQPHSSG